MICAFCQRDIRRPCHSEEEVQRRATSHVEPCERALKIQRWLQSLSAPEARPVHGR